MCLAFECLRSLAVYPCDASASGVITPVRGLPLSAVAVRSVSVPMLKRLLNANPTARTWTVRPKTGVPLPVGLGRPVAADRVPATVYSLAIHGSLQIRSGVAMASSRTVLSSMERRGRSLRGTPGGSASCSGGWLSPAGPSAQATHSQFRVLAKEQPRSYGTRPSRTAHALLVACHPPRETEAASVCGVVPAASVDVANAGVTAALEVEAGHGVKSNLGDSRHVLNARITAFEPGNKSKNSSSGLMFSHSKIA